MPELPEIKHMADQMQETLCGKAISKLFCTNEKCLNMPLMALQDHSTGKAIAGVISRGKWIRIDLDDGARIMLSLGMGGHAVYHALDETDREDWRVLLSFDDGTRLSIAFWWFGYVHYVEAGSFHKMSDDLGLEPLSPGFTFEAFSKSLENRRGSIKSFLLNQRRIAGIGNFYIQDTLWRAKIHPLSSIAALSTRDITNLYTAINDYLTEAYALGGASYERDLFDQPGGYGSPEVGYKEGAPCPLCQKTIIKIKTGSTASFICPSCQKLKKS